MSKKLLIMGCTVMVLIAMIGYTVALEPGSRIQIGRINKIQTGYYVVVNGQGMFFPFEDINSKADLIEQIRWRVMDSNEQEGLIRELENTDISVSVTP